MDEDEFKLYVKYESQVSPLVDRVYTFSAYIRMVFGLNKWGVLNLNRGKINRMDVLTVDPCKSWLWNNQKDCLYVLGDLEMDKLMEKRWQKLKVYYFGRLR